jgi:hypothetical protein
LFGGSEHPKIILGNRPRRRPPIVEEKRDVFACTGFFRFLGKFARGVLSHSLLRHETTMALRSFRRIAQYLSDFLDTISIALAAPKTHGVAVRK